MKTSPPPPPPPASISCSSSSSSSSASAPNQIAKPKVKRSKKKSNSEKRHYGNSPGRRSSMYRGVTRHRWTGRYEAHLWDKNSWNPVQNKKGRQVYLGAYDDEEAAAHTYDLAALKYWGPDTILNFPLSTYTNEFAEMQKVTKEEYLASLRRRSSGFSRGVSKYRGVARHHHNGRWEARIGRVYGNKYLYLGTYSTQEEAAAAYDLAAIEYRGVNAVTNFDISHYIRNPPPIQVPSSPPPPPPPPQPPTFHAPPEAPPQIHLPENADPIDQTAVVDPLTEPPWDVCMATAYSPMPVSDIAIGRTNELHDLFNGYGFEENIEYLFEASEATGGSFEGEGWGNDLKVDGIFENSAEFDDDFLNGVDDGKDCGLIEEILTSAAAAADSSSYPPPISICS